jgi:hypothetical protein
MQAGAVHGNLIQSVRQPGFACGEGNITSDVGKRLKDLEPYGNSRLFE